MNEQLKESFFKSINEIAWAARFTVSTGVYTTSLQYVNNALKELLFIKNELEASIQKEAK